MKLSVFGGTGFIGSKFLKLYPENLKINRNNLKPKSENILYLISIIN